MIHRIEYLKDKLGNNYLGVNIGPDFVSLYLDKLKSIIPDEYEVYVKNQQNRDNGHHHITVINVSDYNELSKKIGMDKFINSLENIFDTEIDDIKFLGIGTVSRGENRSYFIVVKSDKLQEVRNIYGLGEFDFHVTLGFKHKDVFGVRKNEVLEEKEPFKKLLGELYYKSGETFDFIKELENFEGDEDFEIEPIKILDTYANFRIGKNDYFSVGLVDNKLRIVAKWQDNENLPILSNTIISRKLNQK